MKILFAGTPEVALPSLRLLVEQGHDIVAVLTRPDAPAGRGKKLVASPVSQFADEHAISVLKPDRVDDETIARIRDLHADVAAVVAYGQILSETALEAVRWGWINLHFSLLPRWRGAAPVQRAIWSGDPTTGVTAFRIVPALDAGPVYRSLEVRIGEQETSGELLTRLAESGAGVLASALDDAAKQIEPREQSGEGITLAAKITPADVKIDWTAPACDIARIIRASSPIPGAWTTLGHERFSVLAAKADADDLPLPPGQLAADRRHLWVGTGTQRLELTRVKAAGRKPMSGADWARGRHEGCEGLCFDA